jgi:hypothetical protein
MSDSQQQVIAILSAEPSERALIQLISWLDLACAAEPVPALPHQLLARAVAAVGSVLHVQHPYQTIADTMRAAAQFALDPTPENHTRYQSAATGSYPFGPGDGCYSLAQTGYAGCELGSGCRSGSGCLYIHELGATVVLQAIAEQLLPWLLGEGDPLAGSSASITSGR